MPGAAPHLPPWILAEAEPREAEIPAQESDAGRPLRVLASHLSRFRRCRFSVPQRPSPGFCASLRLRLAPQQCHLAADSSRVRHAARNSATPHHSHLIQTAVYARNNDPLLTSDFQRFRRYPESSQASANGESFCGSAPCKRGASPNMDVRAIEGLIIQEKDDEVCYSQLP